MSEERFDRIEMTLQRLMILHEDTLDRVKVIAEGVARANERLDGHDVRFDAVDRRLETLDHRLGRVESGLERVEGLMPSVVREELNDHARRITSLEKGTPSRR